MKRIILICSIAMLPVFMFLVPSASESIKIKGDHFKVLTILPTVDSEPVTVFVPEKAAKHFGGESSQMQII